MIKNFEEPVIIDQTFHISIENVWKALTELEQMKQWFFEDIVSFKPEVGFETKFDLQVEDKIYEHLWKLTEVIPMKKITYNWKYDGYPGDSFVSFELIEMNLNTQLILTHRVVECFPLDNPIFSRQSTVDGWSYFIKERLKQHLE